MDLGVGFAGPILYRPLRAYPVPRRPLEINESILYTLFNLYYNFLIVLLGLGFFFTGSKALKKISKYSVLLFSFHSSMGLPASLVGPLMVFW